MNRRMWWALRVYPAAWRERYASEFAALLEDVKPGWREWGDVVRGGLKMRVTWNLGTVMTVCGVLGAAVACGFALRLPSVYISTAVVRLANGGTYDHLADHLQRVQTEALSRTSLATIIQSLDLYKEER